MPSIFALSDAALSTAPTFQIENELLNRIVNGRVTNQSLFLEFEARQQVVVEYQNILEGTDLRAAAPCSGIALSALSLPRTQRQRDTFLFGTRPWIGSPHDKLRANVRALPRVISPGRISREIPVDVSDPRRGQRNIGDVRLSNPDGKLDFLIRDYILPGEKIRAYLGEPSTPSEDWWLIYEAIIDDVEATRTQIRISVTTVADELDRPFQLRQYTGNGKLTGDQNVKGRLKPVALGEIWGAEPVLINAGDNIYAVNDGPIQGIDWVREGGLDYTFVGDFRDYDSLASATLNAGEYATSLENGIFRIGVNLPGLVFPLRVGVLGDNKTGYSAVTGTILYRLARNRAFLAADQVNLSSFNNLPKGKIGYYYTGAQATTVRQVFDDLLGGVNGYYGVGRSDKLSVGRLLAPEFVLTNLSLRNEQIFNLRVEPRPDENRFVQPFTYQNTASPVTEDEVSPAANSDVADRLQRPNLEGSESVGGSSGIAPIDQSVLTTYFINLNDAAQIAKQAVQFSAAQRVPYRADLGRQGLFLDMGSCVELQSDRFITDYRGIVYSQEDRLGATIQTEVTALG